MSDSDSRVLYSDYMLSDSQKLRYRPIIDLILLFLLILTTASCDESKSGKEASFPGTREISASPLMGAISPFVLSPAPVLPGHSRRLFRDITKTVLEWAKEDTRTNDEPVVTLRVGKIFRLFAHCNNQELYAVSLNDVVVWTKRAQKYEAYWSGSGGSPILVVGYGSRSKILFSEQVIDLLGVSGNILECPDILVVFHGSEFARVGSEYGRAWANFNTTGGLYVITRAPLVEEKRQLRFEKQGVPR